MSKAIRVVVVDDDPSIRAWTRMALESCDDLMVVGEATDGADAVERAVALHPDAIVMDLQMPVVDGYTALVMLQRRLPHIHVVVHSGEDDADLLHDVRRLGVVFVPKTGDADALIEAVRAIPAQRRATAMIA